MTSPILEALGQPFRIVDLGRPMFQGMPQSPNHPPFTHSLPRRHGDMVRGDGGSASNDLIVTGTHVGTHIDALAHVSHDGKLFGGVAVGDALVGGKYLELGVHTISPMFCRGVLLDVARALGVEVLDPGYEITPEDLERTIARQGTSIAAGDVVLIRSGWGRRFDEGADAYTGRVGGVPGVGESAALWLADRLPRALGADTIAFECLAPGAGHALLPAHRVLLVERGIYIIEAMALEELSDLSAYEFGFSLSPLAIVGATGSPVRPFAVVDIDG